MGLFQQVEGENAVLVENGIYRQCEVYSRDGWLYAKSAGGFIRLYADGSTSKAKSRLETLTWDGPLYKDGLGRLACNPPGNAIAAGWKPIDTSTRQKLLGAAE